ncbi:glyoxylate/hydroxypyruvate reductase A [Rhodobacteraceae bacterium 2CG4]|uniref:Glyoxylate/hydroxypyruvate reductase A n=1 Tax=Halovulum marinum TaxID=2662447 RepID=A0A6L5YUY5_9RHOB|nr:glyoxylate/hydroxypyruvate reductase A [Halovulum marinum]MSU88098.1 glyoxylate/hydroxypyruvate reductase A [Halovulum marinum]
MPKVLYAGADSARESYARELTAGFAEAGVAAELVFDAPDPAAIDYIVYAPASGLRDFTPFTNTRAVLSLWAGVETIVGNRTLTQPLTRMVDPGLTEGMREWVTGHVLRHHLGMDAHITGQDGVWRGDRPAPLARHRPVAVLGLGALGTTCARALAGLGFPVTGWSRAPRAVDGVDCRHGVEALAQVLSGAQILVLLLPATPETDGLMNAERLALLPPGAVIVNPGRGSLIDEPALLAALDSGRVGHATLDVFRTEPLPPGHPFWAHPRVTVTPHIASATRPETAARAIVRNISRAERGEPLEHVVDRARGY